VTTSALKHDVFQAIADPTRRQLLRTLADKEEPVVRLSRQFPVSRTAINKHLGVLLDAGLVSSHRVGRETRYRSRLEPLIQVKEWLDYFWQFWDSRLANLQNLVEDKEAVKRRNTGQNNLAPNVDRQT
jgi:DNA-binding transcriptional ArsR family regulator